MRLVIDMGQRLLHAVQGEVRRGRVIIRRAVTVETPEDLDTTDPKATGAWLAETLRGAGIRSTRAIFVVSRDVASHKRLILPTTHAEDLPDMTRLAMQRELGPAAEGTIIDFIPGGREDAGTVVQAFG